MISGFIFFNKKEPKIKNFIKIAIIIIFYSLVSIFIIKLLTIYTGKSPYPIYLNIFKTPSYYHLWFLYPLIGIYIISSLITIREKDSVNALLIITLIFIFFNKNTANLIFSAFGVNVYFYFMLDGDFIFYLLYAISGAYIKHIKIKNNYLFLSALVYVASIALISISTSVISP
ncbi:acyltransferase family protein, partial [Morganella morganii]